MLQELQAPRCALLQLVFLHVSSVQLCQALVSDRGAPVVVVVAEVVVVKPHMLNPAHGE